MNSGKDIILLTLVTEMENKENISLLKKLPIRKKLAIAYHVSSKRQTYGKRKQLHLNQTCFLQK